MPALVGFLEVYELWLNGWTSALDGYALSAHRTSVGVQCRRGQSRVIHRPLRERRHVPGS